MYDLTGSDFSNRRAAACVKEINKSMRSISITVIALTLLAFRCDDQRGSRGLCITGKIVGQKCGVYALQLDSDTLGARDWERRMPEGENKTYPRVVGLLGLPEEFTAEGQRIYVTLRKPTQEEASFFCTFDWPGPPEPHYFVVSATASPCVDSDE